jgi:hypothetical protein
MRFRTVVVGGLALLLGVGLAACNPVVQVRVEGNGRTIFEGPVSTSGHTVRAASDTASRVCDGTNNHAHTSAGPTPTASASDAMKIAGLNFDGTWNPGVSDYFIERWGPDAENPSTNSFWGLLDNGKFPSVGGCQFQTAAGHEVLWAYNAFSNRPFLRLAVGSDNATGPSPPNYVIYVDSGRNLAVKVQRYTGAQDGAAQAFGPAVGVKVAPVTTAANGFQTVNTASALAKTTGSAGTATYTFPSTGWFRIKAAATGFITSNRLDVCVRPSPSTDCGPEPADAAVRTP